MKARCCICDEEFNLSDGELLQIEEEIEEYVCEKCSEICMMDVPVWWKEIQSHVN